MIQPAQLIEEIATEYSLNEAAGKQVLVTLSGGLDSTVVLYLTLKLGMKPIGIQFNYHSRPKAEQVSLEYICRVTNTSLTTLNYPSIESASASTLSHHLAESNSLHYLLAANFAAVNGIQMVFGGLIKNDCEGPQGQNSKFLIDRINQLAAIEFSASPPRIIMPFIELDKVQVVQLGKFLDAPLEQTWSCEKDTEAPCGICGNCQIRIFAIE